MAMFRITIVLGIRKTPPPHCGKNSQIIPYFFYECLPYQRLGISGHVFANFGNVNILTAPILEVHPSSPHGSRKKRFIRKPKIIIQNSKIFKDIFSEN